MQMPEKHLTACNLRVKYYSTDVTSTQKVREVQLPKIHAEQLLKEALFVGLHTHAHTHPCGFKYLAMILKSRIKNVLPKFVQPNF